jgi:hypothetical protein
VSPRGRRPTTALHQERATTTLRGRRASGDGALEADRRRQCTLGPVTTTVVPSVSAMATAAAAPASVARRRIWGPARDDRSPRRARRRGGSGCGIGSRGHARGGGPMRCARQRCASGRDGGSKAFMTARWERLVQRVGIHAREGRPLSAYDCDAIQGGSSDGGFL